MSAAEPEVHLYWATGCTSCLRVKEFLERHNTPFVSHNVVNADAGDDETAAAVGIKGVDPDLMAEMADHGLPQHVPIVRQGSEWADGKDLETVAALVDIEYDAEPLPVEELYRRLTVLLETTQAYLDALPDDELETHIPNRPRSYAALVQHIFSLPDVFMMHEAGVPMTGVPRMEHHWDHNSKVALRTYGSSVQGRLDDWFDTAGQTCEWSATADVFWGQPTKHAFFERTTWHTGQHVRQLEWVLTEVCGVEIDDPLDDALWDDLPMPEKVWNED